jgi:WD40 repeat protein
VLVNLYGSSEIVPETLVRNLLCHFERLNIQNYVFVGPNSSFLLELARRGHLVIDRDLFFDSVRTYIPKKNLVSKPETMKEFWVNIFIIKKSLQLNYNIWILGPDIIPVRNDLFLPDTLFDSNTAFYFGDDTYKVLFVRSLSSARKVLESEDFIFNAANIYEESGWVNSMGKLFEKHGAKKIDVEMVGVNIISSSVILNTTSPLLSAGDSNKVAFWSGKTGPVLVQKKLEELGLWILDGDSSCTAVICHTS